MISYETSLGGVAADMLSGLWELITENLSFLGVLIVSGLIFWGIRIIVRFLREEGYL